MENSDDDDPDEGDAEQSKGQQSQDQGGGAGSGGSQTKNSGAGDDTGQQHRGLSTEDVDALTATMASKLAGQFLTKNDMTELKKVLSEEITGATKRQVEDIVKKLGLKAADQNAGDGQQTSTPEQLLASTVTLGDGSKISVADLGKAYLDFQEFKKESSQKDSERKRQEAMLAIKGGLQTRNVIPQNIDLVADSIANKVIFDETGKMIAKGVSVPNPLPNVEPKFLIQDLPLDEYLDTIIKANPQIVSNQIKGGTGSGGTAGRSTVDQGEFTAEKALDDPKVYQKWMEQDAKGCEKAIVAYQQKGLKGEPGQKSS